MKSKLKHFMMGVIIATLLMSVAFGEPIMQTIKVKLNAVNLEVNGKKVDAPNILYNGTTYVPLRETAEMLGKEVSWNKSTNTAGISDKSIVQKPNNEKPKENISYSRDNPAPIGVSQVGNIRTLFRDHKSRVTVLEVLRGPELEKRIIEEYGDQSLRSLDKGEEYIVVKVKEEIIDAKEDKEIMTNEGDYKLYTGTNVKNTKYNLYNFEPSIAVTLYKNGSHEGYLMYKIDKTDASHKLAFGLNDDGSGGIWFDLSK